jgi:hypothetical protein
MRARQFLVSNPDPQWEGFQPVAYGLDLRVLDLPLTQQIGEGKKEVATTVGDVFEALKDKQITPETLNKHGASVWMDVATTDGTKFRLSGHDFICSVLYEMLKLRAEGIFPFTATWYYFDWDFRRDDPYVSYSFFVVADGKIVRDRVIFYDHRRSGFDPKVFEKADHSKPVWSEAAWADATAKYWYRKFYSETRTGQLMLLRSDSPTLFFCEDRQGPDIIGALGIIGRSLNSVRILLWVVVILGLLTLALRWK